MMIRLKVACLSSGNLGYSTLLEIAEHFNIIAIFTNKDSLAIISMAKERNIPCFVGNPRNGKGTKFLKDILKISVDYIISINYLFLIEKDLINYSTLGTINIHGSLLPKYRGRTPHVWAIINGEKETGVTVHYISEGCDEGDIILQKKIQIDEEATGQDILNDIGKCYPGLIVEALNLIDSSNFVPIAQNNSFATFFGKRTPDDGEVNWSWTKEQIKNWIRAQAFPYPGAFGYYKSTKFVINSCRFSSLGFSDSDTNGLIKKVASAEIFVKVSNGVVELTGITHSPDFKEGDVLITSKDVS